MSNASLIPVVYIGHKERKVDNVAGSGVVWHGHGDVQGVTPPQWGLLSKHPQVWARDVDVESIMPLVTEAAPIGLGSVIPDGALTGANEEAPVLGAIAKSASEFDGMVLYGTDQLPAHIEIGGEMVQLGTVVAAAHAVSGLSVEDWNGLVPQIRDQLLIEHLEVMRAGAASGASSPAAAPTGEVGKPVESAATPTPAIATADDSKPKAPTAPRQRRQAAAPTGEVG